MGVQAPTEFGIACNSVGYEYVAEIYFCGIRISLTQHLYDTFGKDVFKTKNIVLLSTTTPSIADKLKVTRVLSKNKALKITLNAVAPEIYPDALDGRIAAICIDKSRYGDISVETDHYLTENGKGVFFYNEIWQ